MTRAKGVTSDESDLWMPLRWHLLWDLSDEGSVMQRYMGKTFPRRTAVPNLFGTREQFCGRQFFHGLGWGAINVIQVHYVYCALYFYYYYIVIYDEIILQLTIMPTGGGARAVMQAMESGCKYRWNFTCLPAAHYLLCGPVPNRLQTRTGPGVGDPWCRGTYKCKSQGQE